MVPRGSKATAWVWRWIQSRRPQELRPDTRGQCRSTAGAQGNGNCNLRTGLDRVFQARNPLIRLLLAA
eukprot:3248249-Rhodomonas_salina.1